ncbi:gentisate 1,2-dioxygenase [Amorphus sp. 3PC139-8]|uniref:gentisate 1,2-dioxygenase n=1 Tax=Amorphus sp. 3PC139-8 TaxID=2735676 RepID=UPI00345E01F7
MNEHATIASDEATRAKRQDFYDRLAPHNLAPLWEVLKGLMPREPTSQAVPFQWRYEDVRPLLMEAGGLLTAEEAERRVLVLENPSFVGESRATSTIYAGLQLILPGETAPAHRHTASALRFMLEGEGAFTAVGGERTTMKAGDFVITPNWAYHDHGNEGGGPCVWLDGLDLPMVRFFEAGFSEGYNDKSQSLTRPEGDALARFGSGLLPLDDSGRRYGLTTPIFNYPYERTREALVAAAKGEDPDPHTATTLRYANPVDGGWTMPTMSAWMTHVPKGFTTKRMRSTDGIVMCVAEGRGEITTRDKTFSFGPRDVMVLPAWAWRSVKASEDCFLFCLSDRVAQEKLGFFREERA